MLELKISNSNFFKKENVNAEKAFLLYLEKGSLDRIITSLLFFRYVMNLQYSSDYSSQCEGGNVCREAGGQRHYAVFSSSTSKKYKLKQSLMMDDICESDTLVHDMCPRDCSCLSNNFQAPFFSCDCKSEADVASDESGPSDQGWVMPFGLHLKKNDRISHITVNNWYQ